MNNRPHPGPLTQERETWLPISSVPGASFDSSGSRCELPVRGDRHIDFGKSQGGRKPFPLPAGEGQGEGERCAAFHSTLHTFQLS
jgi:hypothetical protein